MLAVFLDASLRLFGSSSLRQYRETDNARIVPRDMSEDYIRILKLLTSVKAQLACTRFR